MAAGMPEAAWALTIACCTPPTLPLTPCARRVEWEFWFTSQDGCGQARMLPLFSFPLGQPCLR